VLLRTSVICDQPSDCQVVPQDFGAHEHLIYLVVLAGRRRVCRHLSPNSALSRQINQVNLVLMSPKLVRHNLAVAGLITDLCKSTLKDLVCVSETIPEKCRAEPVTCDDHRFDRQWVSGLNHVSSFRTSPPPQAAALTAIPILLVVYGMPSAGTPFVPVVPCTLSPMSSYQPAAAWLLLRPSLSVMRYEPLLLRGHWRQSTSNNWHERRVVPGRRQQNNSRRLHVCLQTRRGPARQSR
jgi:hypothetical protein